MSPKSKTKYTSSRETKIASAKRARSDTEDSDQDVSTKTEDYDNDNISDYEDNRPKKRAKAPPSKRQKLDKLEDIASTTKKTRGALNINGLSVNKVPSWAQSSEVVFSKAWWRDVTSKDGFWIDFDKFLPKLVRGKRLSVNIALNLDVPTVKIEQDAAATPKGGKARSRKTTVSNGIKAERDETRQGAVQDSDSNSSDEESGDFSSGGRLGTGPAMSPSKKGAQKSVDILKGDKGSKTGVLGADKGVRTAQGVTNDEEDEDDDDCVLVEATISPKSDAKDAVEEVQPRVEEQTEHQESPKSAGNDVEKQGEEDTIVVASSEPLENGELPEHVVQDQLETVHASIEGQDNHDSAASKDLRNPSWEPNRF